MDDATVEALLELWAITHEEDPCVEDEESDLDEGLLLLHENEDDFLL